MLAAGHKPKRPCFVILLCCGQRKGDTILRGPPPAGNPKGNPKGSCHCRVYIFISFVFIAKVRFSCCCCVGCVIPAGRVISDSCLLVLENLKRKVYECKGF